MKIKKLVIDRKKWGTGNDGGSLRRPNGKMCCLGFYCKVAGYKSNEMTEVGMPHDIISQSTRNQIIEKGKSLPKRIQTISPLCSTSLACATSVAEQLANTNDDVGIDNKERERQIKELFSSIGVKVSFIN